MEKKLIVYPAIFTKFDDDGEYFVVDFIDLYGCTTEGANLQEAIFMAKEAMGLYLEDLQEYPKPTTDISKVKIEENQFVSFVSIDMEEYRRYHNNRAIKKTLSIPVWLNTLAEKNNINFSQTLQKALKSELNIE